MFYRLDVFQKALEEHAESRWPIWKNNVRAMTKQWLDMGLRPRAVTRDLEWGVPVPIDDDEFDGKCVYVWFEAVQGYLTCAQIWAERHAMNHPDASESWKRWWCVDENGNTPRHLYFLGKDNIPFHTVIWPALIMGLNMASNGSSSATLPVLVIYISKIMSLQWSISCLQVGSLKSRKPQFGSLVPRKLVIQIPFVMLTINMPRSS